MPESKPKGDPSASRPAPRQIAPIVIDGVRYESVWGSVVGKIRAVDEKDGKELWAIELYHRKYNKQLEGDVQDRFVSSMKTESAGAILVENELATIYRIDLAKHESRIAVWPVFLREGSRHPLSVEMIIDNPFDRTFSFDKPSIAFGGRLENSLFEVEADGKPVAYGGMMKKRVPPDSFLELEPGHRYSATVDLSRDYAIPKGTKSVKVRFSHHNHFSKDEFDLTSRPLVIEFADQ